MAEEKFSFEKTMDELEKIVASMSEGKLTLEESLELYQKGTILTKQLEDYLKSVEGKLQELTDEGKKE